MITRKLFLVICLLSSLTYANRTLNRVSSFQVMQDGKFSVICQNGNFDTATMDQIRNNTVCGAPAKSITGTMQSGMLLPSGSFQILCKDGKTETHSLHNIKEGIPCMFIGQKIIGAKNSSGASSVLANKVYFHPIETTENNTITGFGVFAGITSKDPQAIVGIYSSNSKGEPEKLLISSEILDIEDSKLYTSKIQEEVLPAGKYFFAMMTNGDIALYGKQASALPALRYVDHVYSGKLPATISTALNTSEIKLTPYIIAIAK